MARGLWSSLPLAVGEVHWKYPSPPRRKPIGFRQRFKKSSKKLRCGLGMDSPLVRILIGMISAYLLTLSWYFHRRGVRCLHYPSCSNYALLALRKHALVRAVQLSLAR